MKKLLLPLTASAMLGLGFAAAPASAAPTGPVQIEKADSGLTQVRMSRRQMMRKRMMRRSMMRSRRSAPSQAGNARDPNRPVMQQNQGQTSGGPIR